MEGSYRAVGPTGGQRVGGLVHGRPGAPRPDLPTRRSPGIAAAALGALLAATLIGGPALRIAAGADAPPRGAASQSPARVSATYAKLPLSFEANRGQVDPRVRFLSRGAGYTLFLTPREAVLSLVQGVGGHPVSRPGLDPRAGRQSDRRRHATVRMRLAGADRDPRITGVRRVAGETNYLLGADAHAWHTGVPSYASALYRDVYRGVDLVYHGTQGRLEYDFRVAPGADPRRIAIDFTGTRGITLDRHGDLLLSTEAGVLRQPRPVVYQQVDGVRRMVRGGFVVRGHRVGFSLGPYDRSRALVIDPELVYSTYLGGRGGEGGRAIAVDASGSAYVGGFTGSSDFPVSDVSFQTTRTGDPSSIFETDAFVTKLSPGGKLVFSTFLGGDLGDDFVNAIAIDRSGRAYLAGGTQSAAFPTTAGALQPTAPPSFTATFFSVLKADGSGLAYSTYLGGDVNDSASGVAIDGSGRAYVTGSTSSPNFPVKAAPGSARPLQASLQGPADAFVAKLDPDATGPGSLIYSTYLGGTTPPPAVPPDPLPPDEFDSAAGIAVDAAGAAYVTGNTNAIDFPTQNPVPSQAAAAGASDGFVSKLDPSGSRLAYSTYLGGAGDDTPNAIALDSAGHAYVTGFTTSHDFPTQDAFQPQPGSTEPFASDAFVSELSPGGSALEYSSYLGGSGDDSGQAIAVDASGAAYVVGGTELNNVTGVPGSFPTVDPLARPAVDGDGFVTRVRPGGGGLSFSTYLGGGSEEEVDAVAVDGAGNAYITGTTNSLDFPTRNALQPRNLGRGINDRRDAFVAKIAPVDPAAPRVAGLGRLSGPGGTSVTVRGHGFSGATAVRFAGVAAEQFTVDSDEQITAVAPAQGDGPAAVTVTTAAGSSPPNPTSVFAYAQGVWDLTGPMGVVRTGEVATRLRDGRVLALGGCCAADSSPFPDAEIYDPSDGAWHATAPLLAPRQDFSATLLSDGRVLVAGGAPAGGGAGLDTAELFDPASGRWTVTGSMVQGRSGHTATLLADGDVLVTGGCCDASFSVLASTELYHPATGTWTAAAPLRSPRSDPSATLLDDGRVLVAGGCCDETSTGLTIAELYEPATNSWTSTGSLNSGRYQHTATRLTDGRVLMAGGVFNFTGQASAEVYDPATGTFDVAAPMPEPRTEAAAALLPSGKVLVAGGIQGNGPEHNTGELYDPAGGHWSTAGVMARYRGAFGQHAVFAIPLASGKVLVGGDTHRSATTELYDPSVVGGPAPAAGPDPAVAGPSADAATPPPPAVAADRTAPVASAFRLTNRLFVAGSRPTPLAGSAAAVRHRRGSAFVYRLSEAATARIVIARLRTGRRSGGRCVAASPALRRAKPCARSVAQGVLRRASRSGVNRVAFTGRIGAHRLPVGRYRATLAATDAAGNVSMPKTVTFGIARR